MMSPTIDALATEYAGRAKVGKLNVDDNPEIAGRYGIRSIPTLLLFKNGEIQEQIVGLVPREALTKALDKHLG
jgi:thioredoxin 1